MNKEIRLLRDIIRNIDAEYARTCTRENKKSPRAYQCGLMYARETVAKKLGKLLLTNM